MTEDEISREKLERMLPALMANGSTTDPEVLNQYKRLDYRLRQKKKRDPQVYQQKLNAVQKALEILKAEVTISWGPSEVLKEEKRIRKALQL